MADGVEGTFTACALKFFKEEKALHVKNMRISLYSMFWLSIFYRVIQINLALKQLQSLRATGFSFLFCTI